MTIMDHDAMIDTSRTFFSWLYYSKYSIEQQEIDDMIYILMNLVVNGQLHNKDCLDAPFLKLMIYNFIKF